MKRNAVIPYLLIMVFGIGLILALSLIGINSGNDKATEGEKNGGGGEAVAQAPEELYKQNCVACHGNQYEGGMGPAIKGVGDRLSKDEIKDILKNGKGSMPKGLVPDDQLDAMADWLMTLK